MSTTSEGADGSSWAVPRGFPAKKVVVVGVNDDLVIRSDPLEHRVDLSDGLGQRRERQYREHE